MSTDDAAQYPKGAALIARDQKFASAVATSALALGLAFSCSGAARAVEPAAEPPSVTNGSEAQPESVAVTIVENGVEVRIATQARTVGALLAERDDRPNPEDYVDPAEGEPLAAGMRVTYRQAMPVEIRVGNRAYAVRSAAGSVGELLAQQHIDVTGDDVSPAANRAFSAHSIVRVVRVSRWVSHVHQAIAPPVKQRFDSRLALGATRIVVRGTSGLRETTFGFVKHGDGVPVKTIVATRVLRAPRTEIIARGVGAYQSLAHVAAQGFASAVHFAGSALHMIATAYTAGCYGCSGMTATGLRAGFGIIAVDPSIIPLGTKLFIPGYGRAVAGDTGGAIRGNRIDLGFDNNGQAMQWGNRPVIVYLLR